MYRVFINASKSEIFTNFLKANPEWEEEDELKDYPKLADWYNKIMKSCEAYKSIKTFDSEVRDKMEARIVGRL
jgi:hypothetical protein